MSEHFHKPLRHYYDSIEIILTVQSLLNVYHTNWFFSVPLTVASLIVSTLSLVYSAWRLQRADFLVKDLWSYTYSFGERLKQVEHYLYCVLVAFVSL